MSWTARIESRKDRGSVNIGNIGATEDAARRRFAAVATPALYYPDLSQRPGLREISINHLNELVPQRSRSGAPDRGDAGRGGCAAGAHLRARRADLARL